MAGKRRSLAIDGGKTVKSNGGRASLGSQLLAQHSSNKTRSNGLFQDRQLMPPPPPLCAKPVGRLERDFVEVDEIGFGEFGSAIKVRYKHGSDDKVFVAKKSKVFEGNRPR